MKAINRIGMLAAVLVALAAAQLRAQSSASAPASRIADVTEVGRAVQLSKQQFEDLTKMMVKVAELIKADDPESAKAILEAVAKAQREYIADNMDEVYKLLGSSLSRAHSKEQDVQKALDDVLRILREGAPEAKDQYKKWLQEMLGRVDDMIGRQKVLETQSRQDARPASKEMVDLGKQLDSIIQQQQALLDTTRTTSGQESLRKLAALKEQVDDLLGKQENLNEATAKATIDSRPAMGKAQENLGLQAEALKAKLTDAAKDTQLSAAMEKAEADKTALATAGDSVGKAQEEMKKAAGALGESDADTADPAQKQSALDLRDAQKALAEALAKAGEKTPAGALARKQDDLAGQTDKLNDALGKVADRAGVKADAANLQKATEQMKSASGKLDAQDPAKAAEHQAKALEELKGKKPQLAQLQRKMEEMPKTPVPQQKDKQDELTKDSNAASQEMKRQGEQNNDKTPGQESMTKASQSSGHAAENLSKSDSSSANQDQKTTLEQLQKARDQLAEALDKELEKEHQDKLAAIDQILSEVLEKQKNYTQATRAVYPKRVSDKQYNRKEEQELKALSDGEGVLAVQISKVLAMLGKEGATVVFPQVLEDVKEKLGDVQKRLADKQANELTQATQTEIEQSLQEMIDSIRKDLAEHRQKGGGGGNCKGGGGPLIPPVAELKMLKVLQEQINTRTIVLDQQAGKIAKDELAGEYKKLSERQDKVRSMTAAMARGKN